MKVNLCEINEQGLVKEEDIDPRLWEMDSFDVRFLNPVHCKGVFTRLGGQIKVSLLCLVRRKIVCSRCLEEAEQEVEQSFDLYYSQDKIRDSLDIDPDIREQILLAFPMKVLCDPECKGICPGCGVNLNRENCRCSGKSE